MNSATRNRATNDRFRNSSRIEFNFNNNNWIKNNEGAGQMNEENINLISDINFALKQIGDLLDSLHGRIVELERQMRELNK